MTKFPSIEAVAQDLAWEHKRLDTPGIKVRLEVRNVSVAGCWSLLTGDETGDQSPQVFRGEAFLPHGKANMRSIARDLVEQARRDYDGRFPSTTVRALRRLDARSKARRKGDDGPQLLKDLFPLS
jgi:hypothetical protein